MFTASDFKSELLARANNACELCEANAELTPVEIASSSQEVSADRCALLCKICYDGMEKPDTAPAHHWDCLHGAIWNPALAIQVLCWRILRKSTADWTGDLLDQLQLDEDAIAWAEDDGKAAETLDSNGDPLHNGDSVHIVKDLPVKGSSMVAKRGTTVRNIRLTGDPEYVEGRVNGSKLMLKTCFLKKS